MSSENECCLDSKLNWASAFLCFCISLFACSVVCVLFWKTAHITLIKHQPHINDKSNNVLWKQNKAELCICEDRYTVQLTQPHASYFVYLSSTEWVVIDIRPMSPVYCAGFLSVRCRRHSVISITALVVHPPVQPIFPQAYSVAMCLRLLNDTYIRRYLSERARIISSGGL